MKLKRKLLAGLLTLCMACLLYTSVYIYLHDRMDKERKAWPGLNTIASHLSLSRSTVKRAVKDLEKAAPIDTICCEPKKTNLVRQGRTMPKQWTEGRFILTRLEVPTLRENTAERENTDYLLLLLC